MTKLSCSIIINFALSLVSSNLLATELLPGPIVEMEKKGVRITGTFDGPNGLQGYTGEYQEEGVALYLTADKKYVMAGRLYDNKGSDLSVEPLKRLVYDQMNKQKLTLLEKSNWIGDGADKAPRVIYVFSDANCPYCTRFWEQARPWVESGRVQLRHIMVGVIRPDSAAKAATLLVSENPEKALHDHEASGEASTLTALRDIPEETQKALANNLELMSSMGVAATPAIYFADQEGRLVRQLGAPRKEMLQSIFGSR